MFTNVTGRGTHGKSGRMWASAPAGRGYVGVDAYIDPLVSDGLSVAAACTLYKAVAVGALGNGGVLLVSADGNGIERAVVLGHHIVLTLRYGTFDTVVLMLVIHDTSLLDKN